MLSIVLTKVLSKFKFPAIHKKSREDLNLNNTLSLKFSVLQVFVISVFLPCMSKIASSISGSGGSNSLTASPQHSALARVNQAAAAQAAAANAAIAARRRGSYPLNAVAALNAAQQRNLAAIAHAGAGSIPSGVPVSSTGLTGSTGGPLVSVSAESARQQHAATVSPAGPLTAVAAQQLHGLTPP